MRGTSASGRIAVWHKALQLLQILAIAAGGALLVLFGCLD